MQRCFGDLTGIHLNASQWRQAARGVAQAGLGLRSCLAHAPAAYLASLGASMDACADIDRAFSAAAVRASPSVMGALQTICRDLPADKSVSLDAALAAKQHDLSERLDNASWQVQLAQASLVEKAGLGARVFLAAVPSGRTRLEPAVFSAELRFLGVPDAARDCWCPLCDGVLDRHSHHSATCVAAVIPFAIMLCATCFSLGWTGRASIPRRNVLVYCCRNLKKTHIRPPDGQLTSACPPCQGLPLHLISPLRRLSGRRPWPCGPTGRGGCCRVCPAQAKPSTDCAGLWSSGGCFCPDGG